MTRVLIAAGIRLYREGLAQLIGRRPSIVIAGALPALSDSYAELSSLGVDVVLLDMADPEAYAIARRVTRLPGAPPIVAIGIAGTDAEVLACAEAGVAGYLTRESCIEELVAVIESAAKGELLCSPRVAAVLARRIAALSPAETAARAPEKLSKREREIARLIAEDLSNKEIATRLNIEVATVKNHVHNLLQKLHVHSRADAVFAARAGERR